MPGGYDSSFAGGDPLMRSTHADRTTASTSLTAVTDLTLPLGLGVYVFNYILIQQSAATTTGQLSSVNFTGTKGIFGYWKTWLAPVSTASDDVATGAFTTAAGGVLSGYAARTPTNAGTGSITDVDVINVDVMVQIQGIISVTVAGNLELYWAPEAAANATLKQGTSLLAWRTG